MYSRELATIADIAQENIVHFVNHNTPEITIKSDGTKVTNADVFLHHLLTEECKIFGLPIISEEDKEHDLETIRKGTYLTIDPIDGTNNFIYHATSEEPYPANLPTLSHHGLLIGIVHNSRPIAGLVHNYVNQDRVIIDDGRIDWSYKEKPSNSSHAIYIGKSDTRPELEGERIVRGGFGIRSAEAMTLNIPNTYAHMPNTSSGIWDIVPTMAAADIVGGQVTINGRQIELDKYVYIPEGDIEVCKGDYLEKRVFE